MANDKLMEICILPTKVATQCRIKRQVKSSSNHGLINKRSHRKTRVARQAVEVGIVAQVKKS